MAALLGGTQSLHTNSMDEALALPTAEAATLALRTQQIVAHETGIPDIVDPFGGAIEIERRTDRLSDEAIAYIRRIDELGGAVEAIRRRFYHTEIERSALEHQRRIEAGDSVVVGVNRYAESGDAARIETLKLDETLQHRRAEAVRVLRSRRTAGSTRDALRRAAEQKQNLVPFILDCVRARVTLGEICASLQEVYGRHRPERF
jgi:methylmalonyl-CoA mutase N-terminal domain/subunit